jgi:hypothetical protein
VTFSLGYNSEGFISPDEKVKAGVLTFTLPEHTEFREGFVTQLIFGYSLSTSDGGCQVDEVDEVFYSGHGGCWFKESELPTAVEYSGKRYIVEISAELPLYFATNNIEAFAQGVAAVPHKIEGLGKSNAHQWEDLRYLDTHDHEEEEWENVEDPDSYFEDHKLGDLEIDLDEFEVQIK